MTKKTTKTKTNKQTNKNKMKKHDEICGGTGCWRGAKLQPTATLENHRPNRLTMEVRSLE